MARRKRKSEQPIQHGGNGGSFEAVQFDQPKISKKRAAEIMNEAAERAAAMKPSKKNFDEPDVVAKNAAGLTEAE
jgi:hypothetical protein